MKLNDFNAGIRNAIAFFISSDLWSSTVYQTSLPRSERFNKTSLTSDDYVEIYEAGLSLSHYNVLLRDFAYFQFSYTSENEFALAYYPNPRLSGSASARAQLGELERERDAGELSADEFDELAACMPVRTFIPRIRFEYSERQYSQIRHPGAHFHIGMSGEDRWSSSRQMSPLSFAMLMTKFYYPDVWWPQSRFSQPKSEQSREAAIASCVDERLIASIKGDGVSNFFGESERLTFHFTALMSHKAGER